MREVGLILRNDLRLYWRSFTGGRLRWLGGQGIVVGLFVLLHAATIPLFFLLHRSPPLEVEALVWAFFSFMMLGAAANQVIAIIFERADFELLLASPVSPTSILWARLAAIATSAFLSVGLLLMPLIDGAVIGLSRRYLGAFLVWSCLAVLVGSLGFWLTLFQVRWLGVRRARTSAQILAALLGASVFLIFQTQNFLPPAERAQYLLRLGHLASRLGFSLVARAGRGEALPLALVAAAALALALVTGRQLSRLLVSGVQAADESQSPPRAAVGPHRWTGGLFPAAFHKDLRLIVRDPLLLAQILPSLLYLVPALVPIGRVLRLRTLAPLGLSISSQLALTLAVVSAWGEECWDLIRMSPVAETQLRGAKIAAVVAPSLALAALCSLGLAVGGYPGLAVLTLLMSAACSCGCARLAVAEIRPTPRKDLLRRGGRTARGWRIYVGMALTVAGAAGLGLFSAEAFYLRAAGILVLGVMLLGVVACFVLVEFNPAEAAEA